MINDYPKMTHLFHILRIYHRTFYARSSIYYDVPFEIYKAYPTVIPTIRVILSLSPDIKAQYIEHSSI